LFNEKEREGMQELASHLERASFATFLPQKDGLELTTCMDRLVEMGYSAEDAAKMMSEAIFALDVYQVLEACDAVVANLNGRVPDEGAVSEVAMAWARGKVVVGYKADGRSVFAGQDNPLVAGLFKFRLCKSLEEVVLALRERLDDATSGPLACPQREEEISSHCQLGRDISEALVRDRDIGKVIDVMLSYKAEATPGR